jgi:hypothetical protein
MTDSIMSSVAWAELTFEQQTYIFNNLKTLSKYNNRTYTTNNINGRYIEPREVTRGHIYREFKELPYNLKKYNSYLAAYFPDGEMFDFHNKEVNYLNYTILTNWVNSNCVVCSSKFLQWDTRNKSIEYYCHSCSNETFFGNSSGGYRYPPEVPY